MVFYLMLVISDFLFPFIWWLPVVSGFNFHRVLNPVKVVPESYLIYLFFLPESYCLFTA